VSDPAHVAAAKTLRRQHIGAMGRRTQHEVQTRCLADYDAALGLVDGQEVA
jgi:hypothetical protein